MPGITDDQGPEGKNVNQNPVNLDSWSEGVFEKIRDDLDGLGGIGLGDKDRDARFRQRRRKTEFGWPEALGGDNAGHFQSDQALEPRG